MIDPATLKIAHEPPGGVRRQHETPLVIASNDNLHGYGCLVDDPHAFAIEIVQWPAQGWRKVDVDTGIQGGVTEGVFEFLWHAGSLYATNNAVGDSYLFGWSDWPELAASTALSGRRERAFTWRANYHPDGGQLFYPVNKAAFVIPLALPGDDITPDQFVSFVCDGTQGLYLKPNVWHGSIIPLDDQAELLDRQGRVHARVSVDFAEEFGCYLTVPLLPTP